VSGLILSDGDRTLALPDISDGTGLWLIDWKPPLPKRDNTYAQGADSNGRRRVRPRPANDEDGQVRVGIGATTETNFWGYLDELEEMIESVHERRGTLRYEPLRSGTPVTLDLESVAITDMPERGVLLNQLVAEATFTFEPRPYARLDPVEIVSSDTLSGPIDYVELGSVPGHTDAWVELELSDASVQRRDHVEAAIQNDYDPASPEPLSLTLASGLTVSGYAGVSTAGGPSGKNASTIVSIPSLSGTPVVVCATTAQPHKSLWKVRARVYPNDVGMRVRLGWKVGDGPITREGWRDVPGAPNWYDIDLGTINIEEMETGHSWTGFIEAYTIEEGNSGYLGTLFLLPGAVYGRARSPLVYSTPLSLLARDDFGFADGTDLGGRAANAGGTWVSAGPGGDFKGTGTTGDIGVDRETTGDSGAHVDYLSNNIAGVLHAAVVTATDPSVGWRGIVARLQTAAPTTDHLLLVLQGQVISVYAQGGWLASYPLGALPAPYPALHQLALAADATGRWAAWYAPFGVPLTKPIMQGQGALLATGGALQSGRVGIYDVNTTATPCRRLWDAVYTAPFSSLGALEASRITRFLHDTVLRQDSGGSMEGRVPVFEGRHLTVRPATRAGRTSRLVVKQRRLDVDAGAPDTGLSDAALGTLTVTPRVALHHIADITTGFPSYSLSGVTTDRTFDCNATSLDELADVLGTLIGDHPGPWSGYTTTNASPDRSFDCNSTTLHELADVVARVISDLQNPSPSPAYTISNLTERRVLNANSVTIDELADVLGTFIGDLVANGDL
jgi:hypothetical protein